jgi:uncharacterized protein (TIGR03435 family)
MTYHTEDREVSAYTLVAAKPKLKKANPENRSNCKNQRAPAGSPPGTSELICQNVTLAQFTERLQSVIPGQLIPEMYWPVIDATGLEGKWDISFTWSLMASMGGRMGMPRGAVDGGGGGGASAAPAAEEPSGGQSLFEALEKQLGLKMELQKRTAKVIVIDHMEQKPTEN